MGHRDAPTEKHPPPAPDWILGADGHWKPPPFAVDGRRARTPAVRTSAAEEEPAPAPPHRVGGGTIIAVMLVIVLLSYLAWVALGG